jgi:O-acetyl-ADP-ribose deacetylase
MDDPKAIAGADLLTLRKLLTAHVRGDRFTEGHLAAVLEKGHILAILKRLEQIRAELV